MILNHPLKTQPKSGGGSNKIAFGTPNARLLFGASIKLDYPFRLANLVIFVLNLVIFNSNLVISLTNLVKSGAILVKPSKKRAPQLS